VAFQYSQIVTAQAERLDAEQAQQIAELEAGRMSDDSDRTMWAAQRLLEIDAQRAALAQRANIMVAQQQAQPRGNAYGLTDDEIAVAKAAHSGGSVDERIRSYAEQKQRYQHMKATGAYDDTQGRVFKR
jgi:hypothetical protein